MAKKYDIGSSSDMRRFTEDLQSTVMDKARQHVLTRNYDISCPHCKASVSVPVGKSVCPLCRKEINLNLDIHF